MSCSGSAVSNECIVRVGLTLAGGAIFAPCIGLISRLVLSRQDLV